MAFAFYILPSFSSYTTSNPPRTYNYPYIFKHVHYLHPSISRRTSMYACHARPVTYFYTKFGALKLVHPSIHSPPCTSPHNSFQLISKLFRNPSQTSLNTISFPYRLISFFLLLRCFPYFISPHFCAPTLFQSLLRPSLNFTLIFFPLSSFSFPFDISSLYCFVHDSLFNLFPVRSARRCLRYYSL